MRFRPCSTAGFLLVALVLGACRSQSSANDSTFSKGADAPAVDDAPVVEEPVAEESVLEAPAAAPQEEPVAEAAAVNTPATTLASLGPFYDASSSRGWLSLDLPAEDVDEWDRVASLPSDYLWAGSRAVPRVVAELGRVYVVWREGVVVFDDFARMTTSGGWLVQYRARGIKGPTIAMGQAPRDGLALRPGAAIKKIRKSDPMARRMRALLEREDPDRAADFGTLRGYELQSTSGRFEGADRVIAVTAYALPTDGDDVGLHEGVVFTTDESGEPRRVIVTGAPTKVRALVDLDGDDLDELLLESSGYEYGSRDLYRLSSDGIEHINLWTHEE